MSSPKPSLDLIIPCYNPELGWEKDLVQYYNEFRNKLEGVSLSLVVVNDGSTQMVDKISIGNLKAEIKDVRFLESEKNMGKGHALRKGVAQSQGDLVIFTDVDFPYELESVVDIYNELKSGVDVALGYREQDYYAKVPLFRKLLSQALRWVLKSILNLNITDTQCGLKGFNNSGKRVFLATSINRFLFDLEFVMLSLNDRTISTKPVLVKLREGVVFSKVNMKVLLVEFLNLFALAFYKRKPPHNV